MCVWAAESWLCSVSMEMRTRQSEGGGDSFAAMPATEEEARPGEPGSLIAEAEWYVRVESIAT